MVKPDTLNREHHAHNPDTRPVSAEPIRSGKPEQELPQAPLSVQADLPQPIQRHKHLRVHIQQHRRLHNHLHAHQTNRHPDSSSKKQKPSQASGGFFRICIIKSFD